VLVPRTPEEEAAMTYLFPMDMAVDPGELSIRDWARQGDLSPNYLVQKGLGTVVAQFGDGLPVSLSTPVKRIRYGGKGVTVETEKGDVRAKACIVTVSTGALQTGYIRFDPQLPAWKEDAIGELPMGLLAKIPLLLDGERFGLSPFEDILYERSGLQDIYFLCFPFDMNMMIGFVGGSFAWHLTAQGPEAATDFALQSLNRLFGEKASSHVKKAEFSRWANIPWVRGSYSAALPGKSRARATLARPLDERIYFAGEALAGPLAQTIGGAILSGEAVAKEILRRVA
jgi:monoamine oxidase